MNPLTLSYHILPLRIVLDIQLLRNNNYLCITQQSDDDRLGHCPTKGTEQIGVKNPKERKQHPELIPGINTELKSELKINHVRQTENRSLSLQPKIIEVRRSRNPEPLHDRKSKV
ncbi:hypothetical protein ACTXT7_014577 [Hymenolepis weldensis]